MPSNPFFSAVRQGADEDPAPSNAWCRAYPVKEWQRNRQHRSAQPGVSVPWTTADSVESGTLMGVGPGISELLRTPYWRSSHNARPPRLVYTAGQGTPEGERSPGIKPCPVHILARGDEYRMNR